MNDVTTLRKVANDFVINPSIIKRLRWYQNYSKFRVDIHTRSHCSKQKCEFAEIFGGGT
jgi:hypothetical protein